MIAVVILAALALLLVTTPWRRLTLPGRLWVFAAALNTLLFFSMPTTPATSPWRPVVARVLGVSAGVSVVLLLLALLLKRRHVRPFASGDAWIVPLILGALPGVFYAFFWMVGPLY